MLKSLPGQFRQCYDKDPAVYEAPDSTLHRSRSLPSRSQTLQHRIAQITANLYLCGAKAVSQGALLTLGITHVINCTCQIPHVSLSGVKTTRISLEDRPASNLGKYFSKISDKIRKESSRGGKTLIHCYAGVSRSASLCMAYLMKYHRLTLKKSFLHVQKQRPSINPNIGFWQQLIDYERKLYGFNSVALVNTSKGILPDIYLVPRVPIQHLNSATPSGKRNKRFQHRGYMVTLV